MVLHLTAENIYLDLKFTNWAEGAGGFSYERSSKPSLGITNLAAKKTITLWPNPADQTIQIQGLTKKTAFQLYTILGVKISNGYLKKGGQIEVAALRTGLYFLTLETGISIKFQKI